MFSLLAQSIQANAETGVVIAVVLIFVKALEKAYDVKTAKAARAKGEDPEAVLRSLLSSIKSEQQKIAEEVHLTWDVHLGPGARDSDGVLRWYVPRTWMATLNKMVEMLGAVKELLKRAQDLDERMDRRMEKIEQRQIVLIAKLNASDSGRV